MHHDGPTLQPAFSFGTSIASSPACMHERHCTHAPTAACAYMLATGVATPPHGRTHARTHIQLVHSTVAHTTKAMPPNESRWARRFAPCWMCSIVLQGYPMTYKSTSGQVITERAGNEPPSYDFFMKMKVCCGQHSRQQDHTSHPTCNATRGMLHAARLGRRV